MEMIDSDDFNARTYPRVKKSKIHLYIILKMMNDYPHNVIHIQKWKLKKFKANRGLEFYPVFWILVVQNCVFYRV